MESESCETHYRPTWGMELTGCWLAAARSAKRSMKLAATIVIWVVAAFYGYGALLHVLNMLSLPGFDWRSAPLKWQALDVTYLLLDILVVVGLLLGWRAGFSHGRHSTRRRAASRRVFPAVAGPPRNFRRRSIDGQEHGVRGRSCRVLDIDGSTRVNRSAMPEILAAVDRFSRLGGTCGMCTYQCLPLPPGQAVCESNRCIYRADEPPSLRELIETID